MSSTTRQTGQFIRPSPAAVTALTRIFIEEIERLLGAAAGVTRIK
jgi:hypothetical protein